jgi:hypothetical protein
MTKETAERYSDAEATRRMNDAVRRAMSTPHKSHAESAKPRKVKRKKKLVTNRGKAARKSA